jgi:hypothetical protein
MAVTHKNGGQPNNGRENGCENGRENGRENGHENGQQEGCEGSISRAVAHLVEQQNSDGSWNEDEFTGTGFPCVFYLKYHLYRNYFPLYALSRYRNRGTGGGEFRAFEIRPETLKTGAARAFKIEHARNREQASEMEPASR